MSHEKNVLELHGFHPDSRANHIAAKWESWDGGRETWKSRVREVIQYVYATSTRETSNAQNPWSHSTHVPKLTQIYDNLGANYFDALFSREDFFRFIPGTVEEADAAKGKAIKDYLTTKHKVGTFFPEMRKLTDDYRLYGVAFAQVDYVREVVNSDVEGQITRYEGPRVRRISPYDIVFDYTAADFHSAPKIIRRLVSRAALFSDTFSVLGEEHDEETLEKIKEFSTFVARTDSADVDKAIQHRFDGFSSPSTFFNSGKVELLEFYGDIFDAETGQHFPNRKLVVVDRHFILVDRELSDMNNNGQIYMTGWRDRPDNLWSMGPLDNLVGMQYLIDHLENARADAFDQMLAPDRAISGSVQIEREGATKVYYLDDAQGRVSNLAPDATALNADFQIQTKEAQMEAFAGAPRESMGFRTPGEKTAFEVELLQTAAQRLFNNKIEKFERELLEPILNAEVEVAHRNIGTGDIVETIDDDIGVLEFMTVTKEDLHARGKLRAQGASFFKKQAQLTQTLNTFTSQVLTADPDIRIHFPAKERAKLWAQVLELEGMNLFREFGALDEQLEIQEQQRAAQAVDDENEAASIVADEANSDLGELE